MSVVLYALATRIWFNAGFSVMNPIPVTINKIDITVIISIKEKPICLWRIVRDLVPQAVTRPDCKGVILLTPTAFRGIGWRPNDKIYELLSAARTCRAIDHPREGDKKRQNTKGQMSGGLT